MSPVGEADEMDQDVGDINVHQESVDENMDPNMSTHPIATEGDLQPIPMGEEQLIDVEGTTNTDDDGHQSLDDVELADQDVGAENKSPEPLPGDLGMEEGELSDAHLLSILKVTNIIQ